MGSDWRELWKKGVNNKIQHDLEQARKSRSEYLKRYTNDQEEKILTLIKIKTINNEGIAHGKLAYLVGLDRKSLRKYTKKLIEKRSITKNKQGLYVSVQQFHQDPIFKAEIFGQSFASILTSNQFKILNKEKETIIFQSQKEGTEIDFTRYRELYEPRFSENDLLEKILFEFSNRIGAFITYLIIYCLNPDNHNEEISSQDNDRIIQKMFKAGMNQMISHLVYNFVIFLENHSNITISEEDSNTHLIKTLEKDDLIKLLNAYCRVYPLMTFEFEKMSDKRYLFQNLLGESSSSLIDEFKELADYWDKVLDKRKTCEHRFKDPIRVDSEKWKMNRQCSKCGLKETVKKSK